MNTRWCMKQLSADKVSRGTHCKNQLVDFSRAKRHLSQEKKLFSHDFRPLFLHKAQTQDITMKQLTSSFEV